MDASSKVFNLSSSGWHAIPLVALSALAGAASGAGAGAQLGQHLDQHVLDNARCRQCGHTFMLEATQAVPPSWSDDPYPE
jgi:hypothetical protein